MCRSIKTLRPPFTEDVTGDDVRAAALQYVRKISGFRAPAPHNAEAFERAVDEVTAATERLLETRHVLADEYRASASGTGSTPIPGASGTASVPPSSTNSGVTSSA
jgi:hypothetical protein